MYPAFDEETGLVSVCILYPVCSLVCILYPVVNLFAALRQHGIGDIGYVAVK